MSSRSICRYVNCKNLGSQGCDAFGSPEVDCVMSKFGFVKDGEVFTNSHNFDEMGQIYECVYNNLVIQEDKPQSYKFFPKEFGDLSWNKPQDSIPIFTDVDGRNFNLYVRISFEDGSCRELPIKIG